MFWYCKCFVNEIHKYIYIFIFLIFYIVLIVYQILFCVFKGSMHEWEQVNLRILEFKVQNYQVYQPIKCLTSLVEGAKHQLL